MKDIGMEAKPVSDVGEINPPLSQNVVKIFNMILEGARGNFYEHKEVLPFFFMIDGDNMVPVMFKDFNPDTKQYIFHWMHEQVPKHDACIFVTEVWFAKAMKSEAKDMDHMLLAPSQRIDRREMIMVHFFSKDRRISVCAEITRKPDALEGWHILEDTAVKSECKGSGLMVDGLRFGGPMVGVPYPERKHDESGS